VGSSKCAGIYGMSWHPLYAIAPLKRIQVGDHSINHEVTSPSNKYLSLHQSEGIQSGSAEDLKIITDFIENRKGRPFSEQLHAIWSAFHLPTYLCRSDEVLRFCIQIPIFGERLFESGDVALFHSLLETRNKGEKPASTSISYIHSSLFSPRSRRLHQTRQVAI
jgi:hypothetical protein